MRWLWLTLADPEPATNGQLIYSKGLIEAAAAAGAALTVIGLARPENWRGTGCPGGIDWRLSEERSRPVWHRLLSSLPTVAQRGSSDLERKLGVALAEGGWDAVVFDSLCAGWALSAVLRHRRRYASNRPRLVYIAHNHEVTVARRIAASTHGLRGVAKRVDLLKTMWLERRLVSMADVVTSNTPDDCERFRVDAADRPIAHLPPGYNGPRVAARSIDDTVPRRAILVGSLDWLPKRIAVESFLQAAAQPLADARVALQIVGEVEPAYLAGMRRRYPSVDFVGRVDDVRPYLHEARLALVPDQLGGFKLKGLDYVFHRLPIVAMRVALPGMPLEDRHSVALFDSHADMARGVVTLIDDFPTLNAFQERAYARCADMFDWGRIGRELVGGVNAQARRRATAAAGPQAARQASRSAPLAAGK